MKLLYVWIEKFRNIEQQGFTVDDEYTITLDTPDTRCFAFCDKSGQPFLRAGISQKASPVYYRRLRFEQNPHYKKVSKDSSIQSITALVGENASGKSSILECIYRKHTWTDTDDYLNRRYLLVFLDDISHRLIVQANYIYLLDRDNQKKPRQQHYGYEEYIIPLSDAEQSTELIACNPTYFLSVYQGQQEPIIWTHSFDRTPVIPINLTMWNTRNAFIGMYDFWCDYPQLETDVKWITFYLVDSNSRNQSHYFFEEGMTPTEYKALFIYKLASLLFGKLRNYLYHEPPQYLMSGKQFKREEHAALQEEDILCAKKLANFNIDFPSEGNPSLVRQVFNGLPKSEIAETIAFFRNSTYVYCGESLYVSYLNAIETVFSYLLDIDENQFTALYKLDLPFQKNTRPIVDAFAQCIDGDKLGQQLSGDAPHLAECIGVDFEWLSAGQRQMSLLFSGLYQRINKDMFPHCVDLVLLLDEPEVHMHPEAGRHFLTNLEQALSGFQAKGIIKRCQIIMATHSPFIVQELGKYCNTVVLTENNVGKITLENFQNLQQLKLPNRPGYSFNLVMYKVFNVATVELHNELYGILYEISKSKNEKQFDNWLIKSTLKITKCRQWKQIIDTDEGGVEKVREVTLQTYVRNSIHHPENTLNADYSQKELQESIDQMIVLCQTIINS